MWTGLGMAAATVMISVIKFSLKSVLKCLRVYLAQPQKQSWCRLVPVYDALWASHTGTASICCVWKLDLCAAHLSLQLLGNFIFLRKMWSKEIYSIWGWMALNRLGCVKVKGSILCVSRILISLKILSVNSSTQWLSNFQCNWSLESLSC